MPLAAAAVHNVSFLQDLATVMIAAGLVTIVFHRLKQPVVLGYILAGMIVGPHTPPFPLIANQETIQTLSELGIIFLMFSLGLEFSLRKLREVGATAFIGATLAILVMLCAGYSLGQIFGWRSIDSIFLGAILSISSTTIVIKALAELGLSKKPFAQLIFGILIVEDVLAIVMIALLSGFATTGSVRRRSHRNHGDEAWFLPRDSSCGGSHSGAASSELCCALQEQRDAPDHGPWSLLRRLAARRAPGI